MQLKELFTLLNIQTFSDKTAIGLSLLCTLHCLVLPFALIFLPSLSALGLDNEAFHFWMIFAVIPISIYALTLGCKKHKRTHLLKIGSLGLLFLLAAVFLVGPFLGELGEKVFTLTGAGFIAFAHFGNYRLCQHDRTCACPEHESSEYKTSARNINTQKLKNSSTT